MAAAKMHCTNAKITQCASHFRGARQLSRPKMCNHCTFTAILTVICAWCYLNVNTFQWICACVTEYFTELIVQWMESFCGSSRSRVVTPFTIWFSRIHINDILVIDWYEIRNASDEILTVDSFCYRNNFKTLTNLLKKFRWNFGAIQSTNKSELVLRYMSAVISISRT